MRDIRTGQSFSLPCPFRSFSAFLTLQPFLRFALACLQLDAFDKKTGVLTATEETYSSFRAKTGSVLADERVASTINTV